MTEEIIPEKTCTKCNLPYPITNYHKSSRGKYGVDARCKLCVSAYTKSAESRARHYIRNRAWRERQGEAGKAADRQRYCNNREYRLAQVKAYQQSNRDKVRAYMRLYCQRNREQIKRNKQTYSAINVEITKARKQLYYQAHKVQRKAAIRAWQITHPTNRQVSHCQTRGRHARASGGFTLKAWLAKCEYHGYRCYLCGDSTTARTLDIEHRIPLTRGGTNWIANIAPACRRCNSAKSNRTEREYRESRSRKFHQQNRPSLDGL